MSEKFSPSEYRLDSFDEQFKKRKVLDFFGAKIETVDIRPERFTDETPILLAPGWSETPLVFKDSLRALANSALNSLRDKKNK